MSKYSDWMMLHTMFNKRNQKGPPSRDDLAAWVRVERFIKKREETKKKEEDEKKKKDADKKKQTIDPAKALMLLGFLGPIIAVGYMYVILKLLANLPVLR